MKDEPMTTPARTDAPTEAERFRKKPIVIEAMRFIYANKDRVFNWITCTRSADNDALHNPILKIATLEGDMIAQLGDWIIKGVKGEFYPCNPEIFEATYEHAHLASQPTPPTSAVEVWSNAHAAFVAGISDIPGSGERAAASVIDSYARERAEKAEDAVRRLRSMLVEARGYIDRFPQQGVRDRIDEALSSTAEFERKETK